MITGSLMLKLNACFLICLLLSELTLGCGPGRGSGKRRRPRKMTPLVFKQHVPNLSENTLGASGLSEGRITEDSEEFKNLVTNHNPNVIFKDEEDNGEDRKMTQRCKDKLNQLAVSVMNEWPGIKLRVTEAWDSNQEGHHTKDSLHYEGRAVDITTSDRDRSKYGMLARLAVEAGFDWVLYESRGHIHCSVKSDYSAATKIGGCFDGHGRLLTEDSGWRPMAEINIGDKVLSLNEHGRLEYSNVLSFMDTDANAKGLFYTIETERNQLTLTAKHLVYTVPENYTKDFSVRNLQVSYAQDVKPGQQILIVDNRVSPSSKRYILDLHPTRVLRVSLISSVGVYAPLTKHGTIVVDGVVVSCYAYVNSDSIAHFAFIPMRMLHTISEHVSSTWWTGSAQKGIHWYADILYRMSSLFMSSDMLYVA